MRRITHQKNTNMFQIFIPVLQLLLILGCNSSSDNSSTQQPPPTNQTPVYNNVSQTNLNSSNLGNNSMDGEALDIDNDGDIDMIIAMEFRRNVILINDGTGVLNDESNARFPNAVHDSEDIAIADYDKDGDVDIIFVSEDDETNEYYKNNGDATFSDTSNLLKVTGTSNVVETADFNNDGYADLLIGNRGQNFLLINDGTGEFNDETVTRLPGGTATTQDLEVKDVNGDTHLDIIEGNETNNRILINNGSGVFTDESSTRLPDVNDQTREVELADIDNDGDLDLFFANVDFGGIGNPQNRLLLNDGAGVFTEITGTGVPQSAFRTVGATFFDINGDGYVDLLSGNRFNNLSNLVLINDKNNKFNDSTSDYFPQLSAYPFDFVLADFNKDGLTDIYFCNFQGTDILLLRTAN